MSTRNQELLARYRKHIERRMARGERLASYQCPHCAGEIKCSIPPIGQVYDSLVECPHCKNLHGKIVHCSGKVETFGDIGWPQCRQKGFTLVGALAALVVYALFVAGIVAVTNAFVPTPPTAATPRLTVTITPTRIDGQIVNCVETHNHQTGARSRAC